MVHETTSIWEVLNIYISQGIINQAQTAAQQSANNNAWPWAQGSPKGGGSNETRFTKDTGFGVTLGLSNKIDILSSGLKWANIHPLVPTAATQSGMETPRLAVLELILLLAKNPEQQPWHSDTLTNPGLYCPKPLWNRILGILCSQIVSQYLQSHYLSFMFKGIKWLFQMWQTQNRGTQWFSLHWL